MSCATFIVLFLIVDILFIAIPVAVLTTLLLWKIFDGVPFSESFYILKQEMKRFKKGFKP